MSFRCGVFRTIQDVYVRKQHQKKRQKTKQNKNPRNEKPKRKRKRTIWYRSVIKQMFNCVKRQKRLVFFKKKMGINSRLKLFKLSLYIYIGLEAIKEEYFVAVFLFT